MLRMGIRGFFMGRDLGYSEIQIRKMEPADIATGMRLKEIAGWNQVEQDWQRFLALAPNGCFVAEEDGEIIGTVVTVIFDGRVGWVAMVLVPPEHRRKGIGTAMLQHGMDYLTASGVETIKLDATPMGREVYLPLGFVDEYGLQRMQGKGVPTLSQGARSMDLADLDEVIAFDRPIYGTDRGGLLKELFKDAGSFCGIYESSGRVAGYVMARPGSRAFQIGPLLGETDLVQQELFCWILERLAGQAVFFDALNPAAVDCAAAYGFSVQRSFTRMYLGDEPFRGRPKWVFATSGPEKG